MDARRTSKADLRGRRQELLSELKRIQEQKHEVEKQLKQLAQSAVNDDVIHNERPFNNAVSAAPTSSQVPVTKRPGSSVFNDERDTKRQKFGSQDRAKKIGSVWSQCKTVLRDLMKTSHADVFRIPVDPIRDKAVGYFDVIKKPMDLGTVQRKLAATIDKKGQGYSSPLEFRNDVRLVFENCRAYNPAGNPVRKCGDVLSEMFERDWLKKGIESKWDEATTGEGPVSTGGPVVSRLKEMNTELHQRLTPHAKEGSRADTDGNQPMTFEEKRRLSHRLGNLPAEKLTRVLEIIAESGSYNTDSEEEIELDIDTIDNRTLWRLWQYVESVLNPKSGGGKPSDRTRDNGGDGQSQEPSSKQKANGEVKADDSHAAGRPETSPNKSSSSTSSSDGSSSSSGSDSDDDAASMGAENVADNVASTMVGGDNNDMPKARFNDPQASGDLSRAHPRDSTQFIKPTQGKKDVTIRNTNAWAAAIAPTAAAAAAGANGSGEGKEEKKPDQDIALWAEFQGRSEVQKQRKHEQQQEEERIAREKAKVDTARHEAEEKVKREKDEAKQREASEKNSKYDEEKQKAMAALEAQVGSAPIAGQVKHLSFARKLQDMQTDNPIQGLVGMQLKDDSDDDDDIEI